MSLHTETHLVPDPHMEHMETDSVWRVIKGKLCFGSGIRTRYPDHHQNLMEWSLGSWLPSHNISFKAVHNFLSNPANRQTDESRSESGYFAKALRYFFVIYLDGNKSRSKVKGQGHSQFGCNYSKK